MKLSKEEAIQAAFEEVVPYSNKTVKVQVIEGEDDLGMYLKVVYDGITSSKYYYVITTDTLDYE